MYHSPIHPFSIAGMIFPRLVIRNPIVMKSDCGDIPSYDVQSVCLKGKHLSEHEADGLPGDAALRIQVVQVVHDELGGRVEVGPIELVGDIPAQRSKLPTFLRVRKSCKSVLNILVLC
jgi:hypothetical protein